MTLPFACTDDVVAPGCSALTTPVDGEAGDASL